MTDAVLVVNSGSSSFKYQLIDVVAERVLASGLVERIGEAEGNAVHTVARGSGNGAEPAIASETFTRTEPIADHTRGFHLMLDAFASHGPNLDADRLGAVGHRVVHGGDRFVAPVVVDDEVERTIDELSVLAPLHNPGALQGIRAARTAFPDVAHVSVFDTAFHQTLSPAAYTYAIDADVAEAHLVRRFGFHGTSHKFVSEAAAHFLGRPLDDLRQIVFHLGNGASVTAIDRGASVETSMGLTPLEGLVMGTRSGDLDPAVLLHLARTADYSIDDLDHLLNKRSGILGLAGVGDMRDLMSRRADGDERAERAYSVYIHRLRAYAGAYLAQLGGVDVISFTAGVGENTPAIRADALETLGFAGVTIDHERNAGVVRGEISVISSDDSAVVVLVVPTNEELEIARQALVVARV